MNPVRMIVLGAGSRGMDAYAPYALLAPGELQIVAVAEPREARRNAFAARYSVPESAAFSDWREALSAGIEADAVLVATQDNQHVEPACFAMERGYDVLLEKPIAKSEAELRHIYETSVRTGKRAANAFLLVSRGSTTATIWSTPGANSAYGA